MYIFLGMEKSRGAPRDEHSVLDQIRDVHNGPQKLVLARKLVLGSGLGRKDTSVGISREALPRIFDPCRQESKDLDRKQKETGTNFSLVRCLSKVPR